MKTELKTGTKTNFRTPNRHIPLHMVLLAGLAPFVADAPAQSCAAAGALDAAPAATKSANAAGATATTGDASAAKGKPAAGANAAAPVAANARAFLGVEAVRATPAERHRHRLPEGVGLRVRFVAPGSPAADVLRGGDILHLLDDQILCNPEQLRVLVRNHKPGERVQLKLRRANADVTADIALGTAPRDTAGARPDALRLHLGGTGGTGTGGHDAAGNERDFLDIFEGGLGDIGALLDRLPDAAAGTATEIPPAIRERIEQLDRQMSKLGEKLDAQSEQVRAKADAARKKIRERLAKKFGANTLWLRDGDGSVCLKTCDNCRCLTVTDAAGKTIFDGPVETPEQRAALSETVRKRLRTIEQLSAAGTATTGADATSTAPTGNTGAPNATTGG
ncbi:MAG: PDZ domain-containing protein [Puniceicoccales bacterium]|jgi:hypothetical protein|nr:PDZ domain-containing protein [Puniceicoccales bacterium]